MEKFDSIKPLDSSRNSLRDHQTKDEIEWAIGEVTSDAAIFAAAVLEFIPHPYQIKFLQEKSKRIVVCAGRQVGKSTMAASRAIWFAVSNPATTTLIVSATLRQSMNLFEKIIEF